MGKLVTKYEYEIVTWCWANQIYVQPKAKPTPTKHGAVPDVEIVVHDGFKRLPSGKTYEQNSKQKRDALREKIFEIYKYYYDSRRRK